MIDLSNNNIGILKFESIHVKQQNESECGCCLALHMYLTCISESIEDLQFYLNILDNIEDLSQKCQSQLFSILQNHNKILENPGFMNWCNHKVGMYAVESNGLKWKRKVI